jgi:hypothetical protein
MQNRSQFIPLTNGRYRVHSSSVKTRKAHKRCINQLQMVRKTDHLPHSRITRMKKKKCADVMLLYCKISTSYSIFTEDNSGQPHKFLQPQVTQLQICMDIDYNTRQLFTLEKCRSCLLPQNGIRSNCTNH